MLNNENILPILCVMLWLATSPSMQEREAQLKCSPVQILYSGPIKAKQKGVLEL